MKEDAFEFLARMRQIHRPGLRDRKCRPKAGEFIIDENWVLAAGISDTPQLMKAVLDFQNYLFVSMDLSLRIVAAPMTGKCIVFTIDPNLASGCRYSFDTDRITIVAANGREALRAMVHIEDRMNLERAPILPITEYLRKSLPRMRSIHSGSGVDDYPDWQLDAILHGGFSAIEIFLRDVDVTLGGCRNVREIMRRASEFGLDSVIYLRNYRECFIHPDDPGAEECFDAVYGDIFRRYPEAVGLSLVGESSEFPSRDSATTGKRYTESVQDGIPDPRPSPGWYPCEDYPCFISAVARAIHRVKPDAEVFFSTYNWGWAPLELRMKFLEAFPKEATLQLTFDIFKDHRIGALHCPIMDYTIIATEPGYYFTSEAEIAAREHLKVRVTSNLAGATWDIGCIPYFPVPQRWAKRILSMREWLLRYGTDSLYETHHNGWWPNPAVDLGKMLLEVSGDTPLMEKDVPELLHQIAARDFGSAAAEPVVNAWDAWSRAMDHCIASNEDQYGPWRTGPTYPFIFHPDITRAFTPKEIAFPTDPNAALGNAIIKTFYHPYENINQSPGELRYPEELSELQKMLALWNEGLEILHHALEWMEFREEGERLYALGKFIRNSILTVIHIKQWYLLNIRLLVASDKTEMTGLLDQLATLAEAEKANVIDTFECVETDSRLGWEPSMGYVCDTWHLNWKLRQLESMGREMHAFREMINL